MGGNGVYEATSFISLPTTSVLNCLKGVFATTPLYEVFAQTCQSLSFVFVYLITLC